MTEIQQQINVGSKMNPYNTYNMQTENVDPGNRRSPFSEQNQRAILPATAAQARLHTH